LEIALTFKAKKDSCVKNQFGALIIMKKICLLIIIFAASSSCVSNQSAPRIDFTLKEEYRFCNSSIYFPRHDTTTLSIILHADDSNHWLLADYFKCIEQALDLDTLLRRCFVERSGRVSSIQLSLFSGNNPVNLELVQFLDTSAFWLKSEMEVSMNKRLVFFLTHSSYKFRWEKSLNRIFGRIIEWEYLVERVPNNFGREIDLPGLPGHERFPVGFELVMTRKP